MTSIAEQKSYAEPPRIIADDGVAQVEVFSINESSTEPLQYCKGFINAKETPKPVDLSVTGELPSWLKGEFFTVGPGIYDIKYNKMVETQEGGYESGTAIFSMGHWFDGLPLVNRFELDGANNKVNYRSKLSSKKSEVKIREQHGIVIRHPFSLFKTDTNQTSLAKILGKKRTTKPELEPCVASISCDFPFNKPGEKPRIYCQNHASQIVELDAYDLTATRVFSWDEINPMFRGDHASPHSHYDETTGELINFNMEYHSLGTKYNFFSISRNYLSGQLIGSVIAKASYVHSFGVTSRFIILVIFPFYGKSSSINFMWPDSILDSFAFRPEEPTLFYVISREKKQHIATYKSDPFFAFHHINAFEEEDNLYLDIACYDNADIANDLVLQNLRQGLPAGLPMAEVRRFALQNIQIESKKFGNIPQASQLEIVRDTVTSLFRSQLDPYPWPIANYVRCADSTLELPRINPNYKRLRYRYVYGIGVSARAAGQNGQIWDALVKSDLDFKEVVAMWGSEYCYPSEAVFVPRPDQDAEEDDGVLLSIIYNGKRNENFLIVLDAKNMSELARIWLPQVIPLSFGHGIFKEQ